MGVLNLDVERHLIEHEIIALGIWRKNGTVVYYLEGNVGIGTATPAHKLDVIGGNFRVAKEVTSAHIILDAYSDTFDNSPIFLGRKARGTLASPTAAQSGDLLFSLVGRGYLTTSHSPWGSARIGMYAAENFTDSVLGGYILFETTPIGSNILAERVRITHDGNVGIGTSSPGSLLHINSDAVASTTLLTLESDINSLGEYNQILFKVVGGLNYGAIRSYIGQAGDSYMSFLTTTNGGTLGRQMTIQHDGKVGIGTASPQRLLHLDGGANSYARFDTNIGGKSDWTIGADTYGFVIYEESGNYRLVVKEGGNVGIGITDPHSKLEVAGAISSATATITASADNTNVSGINTLFINPGAAVSIGAFINGVAGQTLNVVIIDDDQNVTVQHNKGTGNQNIFIHAGADETLDSHYGGWIFICDGSNWYGTAHERHS